MSRPGFKIIGPPWVEDLKIELRNFPIETLINVRLFDWMGPRDEGHETYSVTISVMVPDRDSGAPKMVQFQDAFFHHGTAKMDRAEQLIAHIRGRLRMLVLHEVDEAFHVGGVRTHDPHRKEAWP